MRIYCSGDSGVWKCKDAIGDHMVDISRFTKETNTARGLQTSCVDCVKSYNDRNNFNREAYYMEGAKLLNLPKINEEQFYNLLGKKERTLCRDIVRGKETQEIEAEAWLGTIFPRPYEPKPLRTVTTTVKPRNTSLVTYLKEKYNYTCQVRGCSEQEVDVAHLHPHRYKDSVDNETNATVLCKNHHWSLDHRRMYIEDDLSFTRYNLDGKMIEESIIECHEDHNIDAKFITKSQDWFLGGADDRKEQAMG